MLLISWLFDKLGYMPKFSIDINHSVTPEFKKPVKNPAAKKTVAKKTVRKKA
jgi:hypothetical protein